MDNIWVISLGGSRIIPGEVDTKFLSDFKKLIKSHKSKKFVVVTGGGKTARKYMDALKVLGVKKRDMALEGIGETRHHAKFMTQFFGEMANEEIPLTMKKVKTLLQKNQIVFCGALRFKDNNTSDGTAADLANYFSCSFINITNVKGLYSKDPKKHKDAKFISEISWGEFSKIANEIKFQHGQHFVLDQRAAKKIKKYKIPTYIVNSLKSVDNILKDKKFVGTKIAK